MRGQSANERRRILADTGWDPYGGVSYEKIRVLTEEPRTKSAGPAGEATYESGARKFPAQLHEELISLVYTRPGPMSRPRGPCTLGESKSESPPLTPASPRYKTEVFCPDGGKNSTNILTKHYHRTHTQDLRLFCCKLSKVA